MKERKDGKREEGRQKEGKKNFHCNCLLYRWREECDSGSTVSRPHQIKQPHRSSVSAKQLITTHIVNSCYVVTSTGRSIYYRSMLTSNGLLQGVTRHGGNYGNVTKIEEMTSFFVLSPPLTVITPVFSSFILLFLWFTFMQD